MNKKFFIIILISMSLSLLGIIAVQSYFIKSNLEKNNQEFELNINQVLTTVSNDIEKREYSESKDPPCSRISCANLVFRLGNT